MATVISMADHKAQKHHEEVKAQYEEARRDAMEILGDDYDSFCAWTLENKHDLREYFEKYMTERKVNILMDNMHLVSPNAMNFFDAQLDAYVNGCFQ